MMAIVVSTPNKGGFWLNSSQLAEINKYLSQIKVKAILTFDLFVFQQDWRMENETPEKSPPSP